MRLAHARQSTEEVREGDMVESYSATADIEVLTSNYAVPGYGLIAINAFVVKGSEPLLVDTGAAFQSDEFMAALQSVIEPGELRWLWLTHTDFDHIGALQRLLAENPRLHVITTFLGVGIMGLSAPLPLDRVHFVNPGEKIVLGNRTLTAVKPPVFDNPSTTGFYDDVSGAFFSSDCFGALLPNIPRNAEDLPEEDLRDGQIFWATVDSPWLHKVDRHLFAQELENIRRMAPKLVLSSHLPVAPGRLVERSLQARAAGPGVHPFVGPSQAAFEQMLKKLTEGAGR
jgi:flavorubredoxin